MFIKILNLEQGHISHIATNEGRGDIMGLIKSCIKILMMCTLIALTGYNAAFLCHCWFLFILWKVCWCESMSILTRSRCRVFNTQVTVTYTSFLFNFAHVFLLLEKDVAFRVNKLESPSPKNVLWQIMGCHYYWIWPTVYLFFEKFCIFSR